MVKFNGFVSKVPIYRVSLGSKLHVDRWDIIANCTYGAPTILLKPPSTAANVIS